MDNGRSISSEVDDLIQAGVNQGDIPGGVLLVSSQGEILHERAYGDAQRVPGVRPASRDTIYDLASLTKVLSTTLTTMVMADSGVISIDDYVCKHIPEYRGDGREKITISDLLTHGAGLAAWRPFYRRVLDKEKRGGPKAGSPEARRAILEMSLAELPEGPRGAKAVYSDLGFLVLTEVLERVGGKRLDLLAGELVYKGLDLRRFFYIPRGEGAPRGGFPESSFAATEDCPWRNRVLVGEVSDDNTHAMGGVAGHAGLFGSAQDVHSIALAVLEAYHGDRHAVLSPEIVREFWRRRVFKDGSLRSYGWDVPIISGSQAGRSFSGSTFGHLGFTGTSLWIDADREVVVVFLTNRVHPSRTNDGIKTLRPAVHDAVMKAVLARPEHGADASSAEAPVQQGPDDGADRVGSPTQWVHPGGNTPGETTLKDLDAEPLEVFWLQCKGCQATLYREELSERFGVCPRCNFHHTIGAKERVRLLLDEGTFEEMDQGVSPMDPLEFFDSKPYVQRLEQSQKKMGTRDAILCGSGSLDGMPVHIGVFDFKFMGGSMGSVVGEKITRVFERALEKKTPAIIVSSSGGARMQEGVLSLMQMSKTCAALSRLQDAGLPYISLLCHPTTGGVAASFSMLGDVNIAEPGALIGFAGPRVIEQTIRQKLPEGFQRSEFLLEHGMLDLIASRLELKGTIGNLFHLMMD